MATKPTLRVVGDSDRPGPRRPERPMQLFERAMKGATNDEALELAIRILENLADRCETSADIGIDSDDRDVENEALVFVTAVDELLASLSPNPRIQKAWHKQNDADHDLRKAMGNRRARLDGKRSRVEEFSHRRRARIQTAWKVEETREKRAAEELVEQADITTDRVLEALRKVAGNSGEARAADVAVAMLPALADTTLPGRQKVINRVSQVLRRLAVAGELRQLRPAGNADGRKTCRYLLAEDALAG